MATSGNRPCITLSDDDNQVVFTTGTRDGQEIILINAVLDGLSVEILVTITNDPDGSNLYHYSITNGQTYSKDRHHLAC